jgi:hypothetical protein
MFASSLAASAAAKYAATAARRVQSKRMVGSPTRGPRRTAQHGPRRRQLLERIDAGEVRPGLGTQMVLVADTIGFMDWRDLSVAVSGLAAFASLAWQMVTWRKVQRDAERLERLKGEIQRDVERDLKAQEARDAERLEHLKGGIRRDVEESLKTQETRLRVSAELRLRMHDKAWQLLGEILAAAYAAHDAVDDLALLAVAGRTRENESLRDKRHREALSAMAKLQALVAIAAPDEKMLPTLASLKRGFDATLTLLLDDEPPSKARVEKMVLIRAMLDDGYSDVGTACRRWNEKLWRASEQLPDAMPNKPG